MLNSKARMPVPQNYYEDSKNVLSSKELKSIIDRNVRKIKRNPLAADEVSIYLKSIVDKYIEEQKIQLKVENIKAVNKINLDIRCRFADRKELQTQLDLVETQISDLSEDYLTLKKLYEKYNLLSKQYDEEEE